MRRLAILVLFCALGAWAASDTGPQIGSHFPGGRLKSGPKGTVVLLHGSETQSKDLLKHSDAFSKLGLVATSAAGPGSGWIVLDTKGIVVSKFDPSYTWAAILVHQFGWTPPRTRDVEGKQLTATIGASNANVLPGARIALTLDIDLQPGMHVYAPGVQDYIPIDWKMGDSVPVQVHQTTFPHAENLYLKAIDETVPAYRDHFRLVRDITVPREDVLKAALDGSGHFRVDGTLRYQACDDRVCYIPQTLRLDWTFGLADQPASSTK